MYSGGSLSLSGSVTKLSLCKYPLGIACKAPSSFFKSSIESGIPVDSGSLAASFHSEWVKKGSGRMIYRGNP